jgi:hypothetical protein
VTARLMIMRWISLVSSKMVTVLDDKGIPQVSAL